MEQPMISVCIPAYERLHYLKRCMESILIQDYPNFEVIVTDDSKSTDVADFITGYGADFPLRYFRNDPPLGTADNMTAGMKYANGQWIKILHDDDWLTTAASLSRYAAGITDSARILYSGFVIYEEGTGNRIDRTMSGSDFSRLIKNPYLLLAGNTIGVPSVTMFRQDESVVFDNRFRWLTDIDCYVRYFEAYRQENVFIPEPLVTVSYNDSQLTNLYANTPEIAIHDWLLFDTKHGQSARKGILVYDAWWRMIRNLGIRSSAQLQQHAREARPPDFLIQLVQFQKKIPVALLKNGPLSKAAMLCSYLINTSFK